LSEGVTATEAGEPPIGDRIAVWRKAERERLLAERLSMEPSLRRNHAQEIFRRVLSLLTEPSGRIVSLYWPIRGEPDLRALMPIVAEAGGRCALPVVVQPKAPLVFRVWEPTTKLVPGVWKIPVPAAGDPVVPDVVIAPVVGYDGACFRLGYGGGYFDRTLAALPERPLVIGVGYAQARLETIYPLPHDVPLDLIATEREIVRPDRRQATTARLA
jgi:5,10-methenyltetrahydrofolate synthetase